MGQSCFFRFVQQVLRFGIVPVQHLHDALQKGLFGSLTGFVQIERGVLGISLREQDAGCIEIGNGVFRI